MPDPIETLITAPTFVERRRVSTQRFDLLVEAVTDYAIFMLDPSGRISTWNVGAQRIKGYRAEEILGQHFSLFYTPEDRAGARPQELLRLAREQGHVEDVGWRVRKDGTRFWADVILTAVNDETGRLRGFAKVTRDITERRQAEIKLQEKQNEVNKLQKIESIGRLAGGIAHDFNNLLGGIMGCAEAVQDMVPADAPVTAEMEQIKLACERAHALVRQLMAFSGRQMVSPKVLQVNEVLREMGQLIRRSIPANIHIDYELAGRLPAVRIDIGQLEQVIMNLLLNARDAMPSGGKILLRTSLEYVDAFSLIDGFPQRPAEAILVSVSDTGSGMTREVLEKIFEPFFTTKAIGKGTGLGLSSVYGIVQQNQGGLTVHSSPNIGTTFKIFLPLSGGSHSPEPLIANQHRVQPGLGGSELIMVVEDEPLVLRNTVRALQTKGYTVLSAANAQEALKLFERAKDKIQLLLTDVIMPGQSGKELAEIVKKENPGIEVLFMSGYASEMIATHGVITEKIHFIEKPFSSMNLARKIRDILDNRPQ